MCFCTPSIRTICCGNAECYPKTLSLELPKERTLSLHNRMHQMEGRMNILLLEHAKLKLLLEDICKEITMEQIKQPKTRRKS